MLLEAIQVEKTINHKKILDDITLHLQSGTIYGFVGRNGSGKTMLFRALSGLMKISGGEIRLDDKVLHRDMQILPGLGLIIENAGLYPELTGFENLRKLAKLKGEIGNEEIVESIRRVGLDPKDKRSFHKYSLGMKQRIILAQAIMEKPDILILDEPTNALDTDGVDIVRDIIREEKKRGALVLIASHNKEDINSLADTVYYLENGGLISSSEQLSV